MFNLGPLELIMVFVVALLVLGPKRLPELARSLGRALGEFRRATDDLKTSLTVDLKGADGAATPRPPAPPVTEDPATNTNEPLSKEGSEREPNK
jgi:sec-independent protein translocase protein TatB